MFLLPLCPELPSCIIGVTIFDAPFMVIFEVLPVIILILKHCPLVGLEVVVDDLGLLRVGRGLFQGSGTVGRV